jgi:hypothetical protein
VAPRGWAAVFRWAAPSDREVGDLHTVLGVCSGLRAQAHDAPSDEPARIHCQLMWRCVRSWPVACKDGAHSCWPNCCKAGCVCSDEIYANSVWGDAADGPAFVSTLLVAAKEVAEGRITGDKVSIVSIAILNSAALYGIAGCP